MNHELPDDVMDLIVQIADGLPGVAIRCVELYVKYGKKELEMLQENRITGTTFSKVHDIYNKDLDKLHMALHDGSAVQRAFPN